jgi:hypothetical protein|nr:MAG TPA: hypothetical protein [Caudoviricetes sp.]
MINEKVVALLNEVFAGESIDSIEFWDDNTIVVDGQTFLVLDDSEADEYYNDYQKELIDEVGLEGFSGSFQDWIIDNCIDEQHFFDIMNESNECYLDDIEVECSNTGEYDNRLEEEIAENGCADREEYLNFLNSNYDNAIEWYRFNFGNEQFKDYIKDNDYVIDWDSVIEECKSVDGRGTLSSYDGEEIELENGFFAYRC